jgi:hypothetical protein
MLIELPRQLMERQALRRIEAGSLSDEEIERLGQTFMKLDARIEELKQIFGFRRRRTEPQPGPPGGSDVTALAEEGGKQPQLIVACPRRRAQA